MIYEQNKYRIDGKSIYINLLMKILGFCLATMSAMGLRLEHTVELSSEDIVAGVFAGCAGQNNLL